MCKKECSFKENELKCCLGLQIEPKHFIWLPSLNALDCTVENSVISFIKPVIKKHFEKTQYENIQSYFGKRSASL